MNSWRIEFHRQSVFHRVLPKRLPLDEVKIDQSFVRDITTDPSDAAIVRAIIAMSQSLGIAAIAEGVETQAQLQFLKENACANFQGYLFSKPIPINAWADVQTVLSDAAADQHPAIL
jgi:EAL domain-containing protein (putative c-di-GMP-specific phosphodiesterase class I)